MFDIRKIKPVHGWREFFGEVGIIVLGVLIALSAEQMVENFRTREDVRSLRDTIDHEIGLNLFIYEMRMRQYRCETRRVAELRNWLAQARSGAPVPALAPSGPTVFSLYRGAWDNRNAVVYNHLPASVRQKYAEFYDELANNGSMILAEQVNWSRLMPYAEAGPISLGDRRAVRPVIESIAHEDDVLNRNIIYSRNIGRVLGLRAVQPDDMTYWLEHLADCPSVIAPKG